MRKYRYEIIIFIADAICMILELVASRVLSPYFGNSNIVWTSVIGIILLSSSIGNYIGGIMADKENVEINLKKILICSAIFVFFIPIFQENVINRIIEITSNIKLGAVLATLLLFFIPSLFMGLLSPIIVKLKMNDLSTVGKVSGKINAIATIGGIFGTFLGGFFLVPTFGSVYILFVLTIIILCLIPISDFKFEIKSTIFIVIMIIISIILMKFSVDENSRIGEDILNGNSTEYTSYDTLYGRVIIYNSKLNDEDVRILNIDSGYESATFTNNEKKNELVFEYTKGYDLMFNSKNNINEVLLIGGAGYSYPKYYISHYLDKKMDVVEIDGEITQIAKKYFYLQDLIDEYGIEQNHRLNLITDDGRTYLNNNVKKYDAILNDAFSGNSPAKTLTTIETIRNIKKSLNNNGLYLTNVISALEGENSKFLRAEVNTIKKVFKNVYVVPCNLADDKNKVINNMVIATDDNISFENVYNLEIKADEITLTDDYCPVDSLIPKN